MLEHHESWCYTGVSSNHLPTWELLRWSQYWEWHVHNLLSSLLWPVHRLGEEETQFCEDLTLLGASGSKCSCPAWMEKGSPSAHWGLSAWRLFTLDLNKEQSFGCSTPWPDTSCLWNAVISKARLCQVSHHGWMPWEQTTPKSDLELEMTSVTQWPSQRSDPWETSKCEPVQKPLAESC